MHAHHTAKSPQWWCRQTHHGVQTCIFNLRLIVVFLFVLLLRHFTLVDCFFVSVILQTGMQHNPRVLFPIYFFFLLLSHPSAGDCCLDPLPAASGIIFSNCLLLRVSVFVIIQPAGWLIVAHCHRRQQGKQHAMPGKNFPLFYCCLTA